MVGPAQMLTLSPSSWWWVTSGDWEGLVTSQPVSASTWRVSRKNSTAPFITG